MTPARTLNSRDHSTPVKAAELALATAAALVVEADRIVADHEGFRDQLLGRLRDGDTTITPDELNAADSSIRHAQALALGHRDRLPIAETALAAAVLAAWETDCETYAETNPLAAVRAAAQIAKAAKADADQLAEQYRTKVRELGREGERKGALRVAAGAGAGWVGSPANPSGFALASGVALADWDL